MSTQSSWEAYEEFVLSALLRIRSFEKGEANEKTSEYVQR